MKKNDKPASFMADSSGLISFLNETDSNHARALLAKKKYEDIAGSVLIPTEVLSETLNLVGKKFGHEIAVQFYKTLDKSGTFFILDSSSQIREQAFSLLKKQSGSVSFTDCLVMAYADQFKCNQIFGFDEVFKRNGYQMP